MTKTRKRNLNRYDKSGIEKLYKLFSNGMATKDAAAILGVSTTSIKTYYKIFHALHAGQVIEASKHFYCESAVKAFCEAHGFTYRHISDERPPEAAQLPGQIGMDEITQAAVEAKATGEKPEVIRKAEDELIRMFEKYIWLLTGTFINARTVGGEKKNGDEN